MIRRKLAYRLYLLTMRGESLAWLSVRCALLRACGAKIGTNVWVRACVDIENPEMLEVGNNVSINRGCLLSAAGGLLIEDDCAIGAHTIILTTEHEKDGPIREQPITYERTILRRGCWLGAAVRIKAGVELAEGTTVGLGAIVTKSVTEPYCTIVSKEAAAVVIARHHGHT